MSAGQSVRADRIADSSLQAVTVQQTNSSLTLQQQQQHVCVCVCVCWRLSTPAQLLLLAISRVTVHDLEA